MIVVYCVRYNVISNWIPTKAGTLNLQARVDAEYTITESDESNNYGTIKQVTVT